MKQSANECKCINCQGVFAIVNRPGDSEAIVKCSDCGKLWYSIIYERINFSEGNDIFEEYRIPITPEEYNKIQETEYEDLDLNFLVGRKARVIHEGGVAEVDSVFALTRYGRLSLHDE